LRHALIAVSLIATGIVIGVLWGNQIASFFTGNTEPIPVTQTPSIPPSSAVSSPPSSMEYEVMEFANAERVKRNISPLTWDTKLATIAKQHSDEMATRLEMFHSSIYELYAENCWAGAATYFDANDIVNTWMGSPKHRTWLLCPHLSHIGVGIAISDSVMYASWTFWRSETVYDDWWYVNGEQPPSWLDLTTSFSQ